jgi:ribosomal protein S13
MKARLCTVVGLFLLAAGAPAAMFTESDWQVAFNSKVTHGKLEVETPNGRIDILTDTHAVEVDHARNYRAGIKQALQYSAETKKQPGLALIMDGNQDTIQVVEAARKLCEQSGVTFWFINEHVSVNDLADQKAHKFAAAPAATNAPSMLTTNVATQVQQNVESAFWLNTNSGVRHNKSCRWFGNTTSGRPCKADEGRACSKCGG